MGLYGPHVGPHQSGAASKSGLREPSSVPRSASPNSTGGPRSSSIPGPRSHSASSRLINSTSTSSCASSSSSSRSGTSSSRSSSATGIPSSGSQSAATAAKNNSMLDKFKLFHSKDKGDKSKGASSKGASSSKSPAPAKTKDAGRSAPATPARLEQGAAGGLQSPGSPKTIPKSLPKKTKVSKTESEDRAPTRATSSTSISSACSSTTSSKKQASSSSSSSKIATLSSTKAPAKQNKALPAQIPTPGSISLGPVAAQSGIPAPTVSSALPKKSSSGTGGRSKLTQSAPSKASLGATHPGAPGTKGLVNGTNGSRPASPYGLPERSAPERSSHHQERVQPPYAAPGYKQPEPASQNMAKSVKTKNTNYSAPPPEGLPEKMNNYQDKNANVKAMSGGQYAQHQPGAVSSLPATPRAMMAMGLTAQAQNRTLPGREASYSPSHTPSPSPSPSHGPSPTHGPSLTHGASPSHGPSRSAKVDSDTQTASSSLKKQALQAPANMKGRSQSPQPRSGQYAAPAPGQRDPRSRQPVPQLSVDGREHSSSSLNSDSTTASGGPGGDDSNVSSSNSTSNSNNSASSTDSVIYNPSSCDELSGRDSDVTMSPRHSQQAPRRSSTSSSPGVVPSSPAHLDHISLLRQQKLLQQQQQQQGSPSPARAARKVETTFDTEVRTEEVARGSTRAGADSTRAGTARETTLVDADSFEVKPMQPIMRSTPYAYLRSTNSALVRPSVPSLSTQTASFHSASRLNRLEPGRLYSSSQSVTRPPAHTAPESDCGSDIDGGDVQAGYMSDGDILRSSTPDDFNSGYMSEGGVSLYARRMQQRFREGMLAVKECMQKSSDMNDDDSFDDSDSISSGDISDTINEISTDENLSNLTGGSSLSGSDQTNPYASLKRAPNGHPVSQQPPGVPARTSSRSLLQPKSPNPGRSLSVTGSKDRLDNILGENWKKYCISAEDPGQRPHSGGHAPFERGGIERASLPVSAKERNDLKGLGYPGSLPGAVFIKKKSNQSNQSNQATITDLRSRSLRNTPVHSAGVAVEDPGLGESVSDSEAIRSTDSKQKRDSECNTDHSMPMFKGKAGGGGRQQRVINSSFGFLRPLSSSSNASSRSSLCSKLAEAEALKGERLSNYAKETPKSKKGSAGYLRGEGGEGGSLERRKTSLTTGGSSTLSSPDGDYRSNTLGRKKTSDSNLKERLFGSRSSLNKLNTCDPPHGMASSMIISNPHATYGRLERPASRASSDSPYANVSVGGTSGYLSSDYLPSRPMSGISSPTTGSPWMKSSSNVIANGMRCALSETESIESLDTLHNQLQQARALKQQNQDILRQMTQSGLQRSDSFKSSKSEHVGSGLPRTNSFNQLNGGGAGGSPSSPTPSHSSSRFTFPLSSLTSQKSSSSPYANVYLPKMSASKDDLRGSQLSLVSSSSSVYSTADEKQNHEIRKLRRELEAAHDKVHTLSSQLSTNAHVVSAFEQSLSNMTSRLQALTMTAESKDSELNELRMTIESLKQQSGLVAEASRGASGEGPGLSRHMSTDSMASLASQSSACSGGSQSKVSSSASADDKKKMAKKKNWLRSSFSKAFSGSSPAPLPASSSTSSSSKTGKSGKKNKAGSMSDAEVDRADMSVPSSPLLAPPTPLSMPSTPVRSSHSSSTISGAPGEETVLNLQQQLHEKDMTLTNTRLEALSSAAQLEQLRDTMNRMKNEMTSLKADNDRLHSLIKGPSGSPTPVEPRENRLSLGDPCTLDLLSSGDQMDREGRRITLSVALNTHPDTSKLNTKVELEEVMIGTIPVSGKTKWELLDSLVRKVFKDYVRRVDPSSNMGFSGDTVHCYRVADVTRFRDDPTPELLPCGYLVGDQTNINVMLSGTDQNSVDQLAFDTLIPRTIMHRYVSLLNEHRRIILCGPSGTGKTYLAQRLAEYLVKKLGKEETAGVIATFNVDHKSSKELRQYLGNIADQCEQQAGELPSVIILDNLHHVGSLGEVFNGFLSVDYKDCPYIIGTMNQATCSSTNLQLHHNFRWVLCANHMEPVKGFLGRYLRRKVIHAELSGPTSHRPMTAVVDWIPRVWQHLNKFLETHSSSDVTIGPRLFLSCPMDMSGSQVWFTDLWNYSIMPYLLEAVREGIQLYGRRAPWEDPADWVIQTYPWQAPAEAHDWPSLLRMRPEDVGYDTTAASTAVTSQTPTTGVPKTGGGAAQSDAEGDPLMNMLMRLQEAASYSSPQSNDSDSTSLDSHSSGPVQDSAHSSREGSAGIESVI